MKHDNRYCNDICKPERIKITWFSYGEIVYKIMKNDCVASAFVDKLHHDKINYGIEFI